MITFRQGVARLTRTKYPDKFARINRKPNLLDISPYWLYSLTKKAEYRRNLLHSFRINKLNVYSILSDNISTSPPIELIINSERKDFVNLNDVIKYAIKNSNNEISRVAVAVPGNQTEECKAIVSVNQQKQKIEVISEDLFLTDSIRNKIREKFPTRYGWILQQFLTLDRVLKSNAAGVLQVNSDTILLRPTQWLDAQRRQPLLVSTEFHHPYYLLLNKLNSAFPISTDSHITHHMLFQPEILKAILDRSGVRNLEHLVDFTLSNAQEGESSPMCVEFELYALGALIYFPERVQIAKFGNINYPRLQHSSAEAFHKKLSELASRYNSVSAHSYLLQ